MVAKTALVTGVSTGIGYGIAARLIEAGWVVFGSVRSQADAERLSSEWRSSEWGERFVPLVFDVTDRGAIDAAVDLVRSRTKALTAVINNAGIGRAAPLLHVDPADFRRHYDVNVVGPLHVVQATFPLLRAAAEQGEAPRIINVSSVSGKIAYPYMGAYSASKHGLEAMSDSLRRELMPYGIDVIVVEPSTVNTPIIGKFRAQLERYFDTDYGPSLRKLARAIDGRESSALPVEKVVNVVLRALTSSRSKARYVIPRSRLGSWLLPRYLPDRWFDALVARQMGLRRRDR
jgi:NAD(P)-dependent dehydrogenase (short-subunit alcohol dehydrogenase family)